MVLTGTNVWIFILFTLCASSETCLRNPLLDQGLTLHSKHKPSNEHHTCPHTCMSTPNTFCVSRLMSSEMWHCVACYRYQKFGTLFTACISYPQYGGSRLLWKELVLIRHLINGNDVSWISHVVLIIPAFTQIISYEPGTQRIPRCTHNISWNV